MWSYDGLKYPNIGPEMLKHKTLGPILRAELKLKGMDELYLFLDAIVARKPVKAIYTEFIDDTGRHPLNISFSMRDQMKPAADMGDFSSPAWANYLKDVLKEVMKLLKGNYTTSELLKNKAFMAYHKSRKWQNKGSLIRLYKKRKETKKVADFLKIDDKDLTFDLICEAAAALQYEPKSALKPIKDIAKKTKKKPSEIEAYIKAKFRT